MNNNPADSSQASKYLHSTKTKERVKVVRQKAISYLLLFAAGVVISAPILAYGFPEFAHDSYYHLHWHTFFSLQFWDGTFYPRWLPDMNDGFGSPTFFFYPPVPYFITSIFYPMFPESGHVWYRLAFSVSLSFMFSAFGFHLWIRRHVGEGAALLSAITYCLLPYHLVVNLYIRGAFTELWAFPCVPLVLFAIDLYPSRKVTSVTLTVLFWSLLLMTHPPTALIMAPVIGSYTAYRFAVTRDYGFLTRTVCAMVLGTGLASVYLFPALTLLRFVNEQAMTAGHNDFRNWWFFSSNIDSESKNWFLLLQGVAVLQLGAGFFALFVLWLEKERLFIKPALYWLAVSVIGFLMMTQYSQPVWSALPALQGIQFPWRICLVLTLSSSVLCGFAYHRLKRMDVLWARVLQRVAECGLLAVLVISTVYGVTILKTLQRGEDISLLPDDVPYFRPAIYEKEIEFVPPDRERLWVIKGKGTAEVLRWEPRQIYAKVHAESEILLGMRQFYFTGWQARILGRGCCVQTRPLGKQGAVAISLPAGRYEVEVTLPATREEKWGGAISIASGLLALVWITLESPLLKREF